MRVIVERLARRCGYDAVAGAMPSGDKRLLIHIRRENLRKQRLRADETGSQVCGKHSTTQHLCCAFKKHCKYPFCCCNSPLVAWGHVGRLQASILGAV